MSRSFIELGQGDTKCLEVYLAITILMQFFLNEKYSLLVTYCSLPSAYGINNDDQEITSHVISLLS